MTVKTPSVDALRLAAQWLLCYEDDDSELLASVVQWLEDKADQAELRAACREVGVSVSSVRLLIGARAAARLSGRAA